MPATVSCNGCGKQLRVKDEYLGKRLKCPQCGETFVATATEEADEERGQKLMDRLVAQWPAFIGVICIVTGLVIVIATHNSVASRYTIRLGFAVVGLGIASLGYWALSSSNRDYNF